MLIDLGSRGQSNCIRSLSVFRRHGGWRNLGGRQALCRESAQRLSNFALTSPWLKPGVSRAVPDDELIAVALAEMPPTSLRLALLEMAGLGTYEALDKLGVRREHRSRVIAGRAPILVQKRR